ncbi:MAG TPA: ABC transporter permease [Gemmatimonadales bacterium]|jgi:putative ABC transport system permease protein
METLLQDIRYAVRQLAKSPGFTAVAVLTLAAGIGVTTAIFSVVDHLMLRELPFPESERIVTVWQDNRREGVPRGDVAPGNYLDWRARSQVFEALGAAEPYSMDLTGQGRPENIFTALATEGFFEALGVQPQLGRLLQPEDYRQGAGRVAVLSHGLWQRRFGGDRSIIGRTLVLDGVPFVAVGVLPPDFDLGLMSRAQKRELWAPRVLQGWERNERSSAWWAVVGRLKPGVSIQQGQADMDRVAAGLAAEYPATNEGIGIRLVPLREHLVGAARPTLLMLLGAVGLVLLIACANVAHLQLARATQRAREFAIRAALGAERRRLLRQLLIDSLLLSTLGAVGGVLVAFWGVDLVKALSPGEIPRFEQVAVDVRVLGFVLVVAVVSAVLAGLAPSLHFSKPDLQRTLQEGRTSGGQARRRLRAGLVVTQTALAVTLLIGAGLLLRSFAALIAVDPGFHRDHLLALQVFYYNDGDSTEDRVRFFDHTVRDIEALPGVRSAGAVLAAPFLSANIDIRKTFTVVGQSIARAGEEPQLYLSSATPKYFETVGVRVLAGRGFTEYDRAGAPPVAVINETLRRRYWPGQDPIGARVLIEETTTPVEIVGVVSDVRHTGLERDPRPELFHPHAQSGSGSMTYFVRTEGEAGATLTSVQNVIWRAAPLQTFYQTGTVKQLLSSSLAGRRFTLVLLAAFATIALLLAAIGIYGVLSFSVRQRTHEIGVRMALGAGRDAVVRLIMLEGLVMTTGGIAIGGLATLLATPFFATLLFGVPPSDAVAFGLGIAVLALAASLASYLPARQATRVDPLVALRNE